MFKLWLLKILTTIVQTNLSANGSWLAFSGDFDTDGNKYTENF